MKKWIFLVAMLAAAAWHAKKDLVTRLREVGGL